MKTIIAFIALILYVPCFTANAQTNRPASTLPLITTMVNTNAILVIDKRNSDVIGQVMWPVFADMMATNPAPNNVRYYGAKGDGVTDDRAAIQACIDAMPVPNVIDQNTNTPSGIVYLPAGKYHITSPIFLSSGIVLQGAGTDITIITNSTWTTDSVALKAGDGYAGNYKYGIRDMSIIGQRYGQRGAAINAALDGVMSWGVIENVWTWGHWNGILLSNAVQGSISHVRICGANESGLKSVGKCNAMMFSNIYPWGNGLHGVDFESANYCTFINCSPEVSGQDGFHAGSTNMTQRFCNTTFINCGAEFNRRDGYWLENALNITMIGCYTSDVYSNAITIKGGSGFDLIGMRVAGIPLYGLWLTNGDSGTLPSNISVSASSIMAGFGGTCNLPNIVAPTLKSSSGTYSISIGLESSTGTGSGNTGLGILAGRYMYTGTNNTYSGVASLYAVTTGYNNDASGYYSGFGVTSGYNNTYHGAHSGYQNQTGVGNTYEGAYTLYDLTSGDNNTANGNNTGRGIIAGSNNTIVGANVGGLATNLSSNIILAIGTGAIKARYDGTSWTFTGNVSAPNIPGITSGTIAPGTTPSKVGDVYIDTTAKKVYFSTGTASSADWTITN